MSIDYAITLPIADIPDPLPSSQIVEMANDGVLICYLYTTDDTNPLPAWPGTAVVYGAWDQDWPTPDNGYLQLGESYDVDGTTVLGTPTYPIDPQYDTWVRPLGNDNRRATGPLRTIRWQGHPQKKMVVTDVSEYPNSDDPFTLTIEHDESGVYPDWDSGTTYAQNEKVMHLGQGYQSQQNGNTNREPGAPGSGPWWAVTEFGYGAIFTVTVLSQSQDSIGNFNVRGYPTSDCTPGTQTYTSGNFANIGGGVFQTSMPSGNWTPTKEDLHFALIWAGGGNAQHGIWTLPADDDAVSRQFWSHDA